jgi:hypothetical protein
MWLHFLVQKGIVPFVPPDSISNDPGQFPSCPTYSPLELGEAECTQLGTLIMEFFMYFASEFKWEENVVTINRMETTPKAALQWGPSQPRNNQFHYLMAIEDPYEVNFNLGRNMSRDRYTFARRKFEETLVALTQEDPNESELFCSATAKKERVQSAAITKILKEAIPSEELSLDIRQVVAALRERMPVADESLLTPVKLRKVLPGLGFWLMEGRVFHNNKVVRDMAKKRSERKTDEIISETPSPAAVVGLVAVPPRFEMIPRPTALWVKRVLRRSR